jgi:hypothetical protein
MKWILWQYILLKVNKYTAQRHWCIKSALPSFRAKVPFDLTKNADIATSFHVLEFFNANMVNASLLF